MLLHLHLQNASKITKQHYMKQTILVTGASSGFGLLVANKLHESGYNVIGTSRDPEKYQSKLPFKLLPLDIANDHSIESFGNELFKHIRQLDVLINNAGLALGRDYFDEASLHDWTTMIDTNVKGLLYVSKAVLPFMIKNKKGHIINIGSTAGKEVYEKGNVYCASKHAVDAISQAMRIDLLRHRIKVTAVHPGAAETEFSLVRFKGDEDTARKVYEGFTPLSAEDVADVIYYTTTLPAHVCINDLVLTAAQQANSFYFNRQPL